MTNPPPKIGPVLCQGCNTPVFWIGRYRYNRSWKEAGQRRGHHRCPGALCGAALRSGERCARRAEHRAEHRTAYSLENARIARSGLARARANGYNGGGRVRAEPNRLTAATAGVLLTPGDGRRIASGSKTDA